MAFHHISPYKESVFPMPELQKHTWHNKVMQLELVSPAGNCLVLAVACT